MRNASALFLLCAVFLSPSVEAYTKPRHVVFLTSSLAAPLFFYAGSYTERRCEQESFKVCCDNIFYQASSFGMKCASGWDSCVDQNQYCFDSAYPEKYPVEAQKFFAMRRLPILGLVSSLLVAIWAALPHL